MFSLAKMSVKTPPRTPAANELIADKKRYRAMDTKPSQQHKHPRARPRAWAVLTTLITSPHLSWVPPAQWWLVLTMVGLGGNTALLEQHSPGNPFPASIPAPPPPADGREGLHKGLVTANHGLSAS